jgi:transposase
MADETLFEMPAEQAPKPEPPTRPNEVRVYRADRSQIEWAPRSIDAAIPEDHAARKVWAFLEGLDLREFYASVKAVQGRAGHPATDPQVLLALWVYATAEGVASARQLAQLCEEHDAFRWLRGGVPINYHMLSDFRVEHRAALDDLFSEILACMSLAGLITLEYVSQDGMRTRASAGASSFRRRGTLDECLAEAQQQVERLAQGGTHPDPGIDRREEAARMRAAEDQKRRIEQALEKMPAVKAAKEKQLKTLSKEKRAKVTEPRVSTTDPEARVMKMPDGGFRPAYNLEIATDVENQIIVGVDVVTKGSDYGQAVPMMRQVAERIGDQPKAALIDGSFPTREDVTTLEKAGITVYAPVRPPRTETSGRSRFDPRPDDTPEVAAWRARMETDEAKEIYKLRAATSECVNAHARRYGLTRLLVRGVDKVLSVLLLVAVTHNLLRWMAILQS